MTLPTSVVLRNRPSPSKRKADRSSSPEVQIVESEVTPSAKFVIKYREAPDERQFGSSLSPPATPSPVKLRARPAARAAPNKSQQTTREESRPRADPREMDVEESDDAAYASPEVDEITDPHFFDDAERYIFSRAAGIVSTYANSDVVPEEGGEGESETYWDQVDSVHESDTAFIDDSAVLAPKMPSSTKPIPRKPLAISKEKARRAPADDLSDYSRRNLVAVKSSKKGKAVAALVDDSASEGEPAITDKHELAAVAEAKRRSLADAASPQRVGSSSSQPHFSHQDNPNTYSAVGGGDAPKRQSKILKIMDGSKRGPFNPSAAKIDDDTVYMDDVAIVGIRGEASPAVCKVKNPEDEDLAIDYSGLCNLEQLKLLFEFRGFKHILNPSRTTPSTLAAMAIPGRNHVLIKAGSRDTIVQFATILFVTELSQLHSLVAIFNENRRTIKGVPQIVEWERMQAVICMAYNIPHASVDMRAGAIVYCTAKTLGTAPTSASNSPVKNPGAFLKKVPAASGGSSSPFAHPKGTVTGNAIIPILDARGRRFNMEDDLTVLDKILPAFEGEVPEGSCVWVGSTCTKYTTQKKGSGLNMNLMWVVVMGTP
ncbi:hypothetical protein HWV62_34203 [Athelia sp. TMB]|nr:hypothetical protein HWV62_34203 [Athelia sp. TMB]